VREMNYIVKNEREREVFEVKKDYILVDDDDDDGYKLCCRWVWYDNDDEVE
jgi:hypothetical protein